MEFFFHSRLGGILLLFTKRLTWHFVKKLQGHVTHTKKPIWLRLDGSSIEAVRRRHEREKVFTIIRLTLYMYTLCVKIVVS